MNENQPRLQRIFSASCGPLLTVTVWGTVLAFFLFQVDYLFGIDGYFHVVVAEKLRDNNLILHSFPWVAESIWNTCYFDKEWLFHVLLVPLLHFGRVAAGQFGVLLSNALVVGGLWLFLSSLKLRYRTFWICILPFACFGWFWSRMLLCRPHVLSLAILLVCLTFMFQRRHLLLGLAMAIYALAYTGHWQMVGLSFAFDVVTFCFDRNGCWRKTRKWQVPMTVAVLIGMIAGELVHPNFPNNIRGLWLQNVMVLKSYWQNDAAELYWMRPAELRRMPLGLFFSSFSAILLSLTIITAHWLKNRIRLNRHMLILGSYTGLYLLMTFRSQRFLEYMVPVSICFIALYVEEHKLWELIHRRVIRTGVGVVALLYAAGGLYMQYDKVIGDQIRQGNRPLYGECAAFINENLEPGDLVFAEFWSSNPPLFFGAPEQKYLVFLDPFFMASASPQKFKLWEAVRKGRTENPVHHLQHDFQARAVFLRRHFHPDGRELVLPFEVQLKNSLGTASFVSRSGHVVFLIPPARTEETIKTAH